MYVMNTKLTLRLDDQIVHQAKAHAARRGKSVSQMFGEFVASLDENKPKPNPFPPVTSSLLGVIQNSQASEEDFKKHLREKHS